MNAPHFGLSDVVAASRAEAAKRERLQAAAPQLADALLEIVSNPPGERRADWLERARQALKDAGVTP